MKDLNDLVFVELEKMAGRLREKYDELGARVIEVNALLRTVRDEARPGIKRLLTGMMICREQMREMVAHRLDLFESPRSRVMHGFRIGQQKMPGILQVANAESTIELIRRHLPERAAELIVESPRLNREALKRLEVWEMAKIGCELAGAGDVVIVRPVDGDLERDVKALLAGAEEAAEETAGAGK
jgi:hypothetical protein